MDSSSLCLQWTINNVQKKINKEVLFDDDDETQLMIVPERENISESSDCTDYVFYVTKVFPLPGYNFGARVRVHLQTMLIAVQFKDIYKTNRPIETKSLPMVTYIRKHIGQNYEKVFTKTVDWDRDWAFCTVLRYDEWGYLSTRSGRCDSLYDVDCQSLQLTMLVEPPAIALSFICNDGVFFWKIKDYKAKLQSQLEDDVERERSPYFYTAPNGYRIVCYLRFLTGFTQIGFHFLYGEYDDSLPDEFKYNAIVTLINHDDPLKTMVVCCESCKKCSVVQLPKPDEIEKEGFVSNNSIIFKIEVKII